MQMKINAWVGAVVFSLCWTAVAQAQLDGLYEFDAGGDGTSWDDALNWERVFDPNGNPVSGNPAAPPDAVTSVDIAVPGVLIDLTMPGQTALDINLGTAAGAGSLFQSGGGLTLRDLFVGTGGGAGTLSISGGVLSMGDDIVVDNGAMGSVTIAGGAVSTGDDILVNSNGTLTMTGGTLMVGDRLITAGDASLVFNGGAVTVDDDWFLFGDAQATVDGGTVVVHDKLRFDDDPTMNGTLTINSGVVRSNEFGFVDGSDVHQIHGVVEINGDGVYQVEAPGVGSPASQLSVAYAQQLIDGGVFFTTSEPGQTLIATSVVVAEFDGRTDVVFTQIAAIPEPTSVVLFGGGILGLVRRRR